MPKRQRADNTTAKAQASAKQAGKQGTKTASKDNEEPSPTSPMLLHITFVLVALLGASVAVQRSFFVSAEPSTASVFTANVSSSNVSSGIRRIQCTDEPFALNRLRLEQGEEALVCIGENQPDIKVRGLSAKPGLIYIEKLLTEGEISRVVRRATPHLKRSQVLDERAAGKKSHLMNDEQWRKSTSVVFGDGLLPSIGERVSNLLKLPVGVLKNSTFQVQRYQPSEYYYPHYDTHPLSKLGKQKTADFPDFPWSARFATVVMYMNDVDSGHTFFPLDGMSEAQAIEMSTVAATKHFAARWKRYCALPVEDRPGINVKPKRGDAVVFYNHEVQDSGLLGDRDPLSYHGSCDIHEGQTKVMANLWLQVPPSEFGEPTLSSPPQVDIDTVKRVLSWFEWE
ncbi:Prolyl 4-hydroxylase 1 [Diplonema papillatum]|nr:Prolyl 4-hydroxylase 1 [Diplonema papillatum]